MRERVAFSSADVMPTPEAVFLQMGMRDSAAFVARHCDVVDGALAVFMQAAAPVAITRDVGPDALWAILRGEGQSEERTPLAMAHPLAERLVLFAATLGEPISARIAELFADDDPVGGFALDAVASAATDTLVRGLAARLSAAIVDPDRRAVFGYSPGHCGWHLCGQRALLEQLHPGEIGIRLTDGCLMTPMKSVSGVLVAGPLGIHRSRPEFEFCAACLTRPCGSRMASLRGGDPLAQRAGTPRQRESCSQGPETPANPCLFF